MLAVEQEVDSLLSWTRHAHLIPSQCVAGGAVALGSLEADCPCDVCGECMQAEAVACAIRAPDCESSASGPTMHLKCACEVVGPEIRRAEASTQREMPKPRSQVMALVGFGELQESEKCLVAVALGGWHSGAGYFAPRPSLAVVHSAEPGASEIGVDMDDGNVSDESVELVAVLTQEQRTRAAQDGAVDLSQHEDSVQVDSTPRGTSDDEDDNDEISSTSSGSAPRHGASVAPSAAGARPALQRNVRRSPAATPASSPNVKRARSEAFDTHTTAGGTTCTSACSGSEKSATDAMLLAHKLQCARLHVVGHFGGRTSYGPGVRAPKAGDRLHARREASNQHDKNAVAIHRDAKDDPTCALVGFLPRDVAKLLAPFFDRSELRVDDIRVTNRALESSKIDIFLRMSTASEELQEQLDFQLGRAIELSGY